ncbi:anti-sigma factor [Micromonospora sp. NBC_01813]|uniref:anti-sigma factor n=1 Tax=Micromonospora sp. NBC_01813 TaxID=2975988 RepID=UPI002DD85984|nr:anti-sigma factor [Micromonospora sp. NBC_01813]WSA10166.1 anti-sigma factor [Micromonospora sp. NBC_01813]
MNTTPHADGDTDEQFVDLLAVRLDRFVDRPRDEADGSGRVGAADDAAASASAAATASADAGAADPTVVTALLTELRAEATWSGPPPGLRESILAQVRAEATAPPADAPQPAAADVSVPELRVPGPREPAALPADSPAPTGGTGWWQPAWWRPRFGRLTWAVPVAVAGAAAFTALVLGADRLLAPDRPEAETFVATGTDLAPGSTGKVSVIDTPAGSSIVLEPTGLPAAAPGSYYAAWLKGPQGSVPIGSFHERRTGIPIELWSGVEIDDYPTLTVTLQAEGSPPTPSGIVVMTASLVG